MASRRGGTRRGPDRQNPPVAYARQGLDREDPPAVISPAIDPAPKIFSSWRVSRSRPGPDRNRERCGNVAETWQATRGPTLKMGQWAHGGLVVEVSKRGRAECEVQPKRDNARGGRIVDHLRGAPEDVRLCPRRPEYPARHGRVGNRIPFRTCISAYFVPLSLRRSMNASCI